MAKGSVLDRLDARVKPVAGAREIEIPLEKIRFDTSQPRQAFHHLDGQIAEADAAHIAELAQTIAANGLIQAITVQEMSDGSYMVVVGERRTRAHLLLGKATIRATVRNNLTSPSHRLLYQMVENVSREDLSDQELSEAIIRLKKGTEGEEPMSQVAIAKILGKSEGWVSRFVKFGDEEFQRIWVKSGIAPAVENAYRLSILPTAAQVDIIRRAGLPEGDVDYLEKPLSREVIDALSRQAKINKRVGTLSPGAAPVVMPVSAPMVTTTSSELLSDSKNETAPTESIDADLKPDETTETNLKWVNGEIQFSEQVTVDPVGQALAAAVVDSHVSENKNTSVSGVELSTAYVLPAADRAKILGTIPNAESLASTASANEPVQAPIKCRVSVQNILALLELLKLNEENKEMCAGLIDVQCDINIPGALAQTISNELMGMIVDRKEISGYLQLTLAKIH